ncbi:hypothetical protein EGH21_04680 [Halomicroarcula sp. F13]|uniref:Secreted protein n=1 Tax=Haloarcula rubra TaxID=2487747 RepID=A0AAW4PMI9_9EURY|nr:hypothetical protein [Halomicroarcula rubra]MBX0322324.1 hypothetical protein [Halomicroarcula rubra]
MDLSRRAMLTAVGTAALAGCTGTDSETPTPDDIAYTVENVDAGPHDVVLAATPDGVTGFEFTYADGSTRTVEATDLGELPSDAIDGAVGLRPLGEGVDRRELTVAAGERRQGSFTGLAPDTRVFTLVAPSGEQIRSYGFSWCDQGRMELEIRVVTETSYEESVRCT